VVVAFMVVKGVVNSGELFVCMASFVGFCVVVRWYAGCVSLCKFVCLWFFVVYGSNVSVIVDYLFNMMC
jgi:hypothetical protein